MSSFSIFDRTLLRRLAVLPCLALSVASIGCDQRTVAGLVSIVGTSISTLAAIEQPQNPGLSTKILSDTAAAVAAVQNFKTGSATADTIQALTIVQDDLALFPLTPADAALVNLALGTVQSILVMLPQPATSAIGAHTVRARQVTLLKAPKNAQEFKAQWNASLPTSGDVALARIP